MEFLIVHDLSLYNGLIGRPTLNQFKATTSTYSITLEVRTTTRLFAVRGDHSAGREYFLVALAEEEHDTTNFTRLEEGESSKKL